MTQIDDALKQSQAMNQLLLEMTKSQKENNKATVRILIVSMICYTALLITLFLGFLWYESQFEYIEETVTEETITQEVSGENSEINNIEGNLYKDSAIHNEGSDEK